MIKVVLDRPYNFNSESQMEDCPTLQYNEVLLIGLIMS